MTQVPGMETSAISVLKRAVELDQSTRFQESLVCYQEGIQLLMDVLKGNTHTVTVTGVWGWHLFYWSTHLFTAVKDDSKKVHYRQKIKSYMDRAEQIKVHVNQLKEGKESQRTDVTFPKEGTLLLPSSYSSFQGWALITK